jgi:hypothetical protein
MYTVSRLADQRPLTFSLLALLTWFILGALITGVTASLFKAPFTEPYSQLAGILGTTCILLLLASHLRWLRRLGITNFGSWRTWALTLLIALYAEPSTKLSCG